MLQVIDAKGDKQDCQREHQPRKLAGKELSFFHCFSFDPIAKNQVFPRTSVSYHAYLRVVNDEATIRQLQFETNIPSAVIKPLKARREGTKEVWWHWHTEKVDLDPADIDSGVKALLERYRPFFADIKKYRGPDADTYLELVTYHRENEEPQGLYLSPETILLLGELGAALDNDCVTG